MGKQWAYYTWNSTFKNSFFFRMSVSTTDSKSSFQWYARILCYFIQCEGKTAWKKTTKSTNFMKNAQGSLLSLTFLITTFFPFFSTMFQMVFFLSLPSLVMQKTREYCICCMALNHMACIQMSFMLHKLKSLKFSMSMCHLRGFLQVDHIINYAKSL